VPLEDPTSPSESRLERRANGALRGPLGRRSARVAALFAVATALLVLVPTPLALGLSSAAGGSPSSAKSSAAVGAGAFPTPIRHVIVIWFENKDLGQILRENAPFERYLAAKYAYTGQMYSVRHDSEPDYLAGTSGIDPNIFRTGGYHVLNVGDLVNNASESWMGYFESMPTPCYNHDDWTAGYEVTHDPFVQYYDVWHNYNYCRSHVVAFDPSAWNSSVAAGTIPNYVMIEPNIFHDQHSGTLSAGDAWLKSVVNPLLNSSLMASTAIFVTYDEGINGGLDGTIIDNSGYNGTAVSDGGQIYTAVVSNYAPYPGYNSSHPYQTYSILTTTEWLLGLGRTGQNDSWAKFPPMEDLFNFGPRTPRGHLVLGGTVSNATGSPIAGAHVVVSDASYVYGVDTGASGAYSLPITSGTHALYICAPNEICYNNEFATNVVISGNQTLNFTLLPLNTFQNRVSLHVTNASNGAPIPGAEVVVLSSNPPTQKVPVMDANGSYVLELQNGTYNMTAQAPGYLPMTKVETVAGHAVSVSFALIPACGSSCTNSSTPLAVLASATPATGPIPLSVNFTSSVGGGQSPYTYSWNFGDGSTSTAPNPVHVYRLAGSFNAVLTVQDSRGAVNQSNVTVQPFSVAVGPLTASINATPASGPAPLTVHFEALTSGGYSPYACQWHFGDTALGSAHCDASHRYGHWGLYTVTLNVTDSTNNTTRATAVINVTCSSNCSSVSAFNVTAAVLRAACNPATDHYAVNFSAVVRGGVPNYTYSWNFGDGSPGATSADPLHGYARAGTYLAAVTVTDGKGDRASASVTVTAPSCGPSPSRNGTTNVTPFWTARTTLLVAGGVAAVAAVAGGTAWALRARRRPPL
jgi:PKD repeat protein